jgi:hypothetical protein
LRRFVLTLDEACASSHQGSPDFRYQNRIVVKLDEDTRSITIMLPLDKQAALIERADGVCSLPGGWAKHGSTTSSLDLSTTVSSENSSCKHGADAKAR